MKTIYYIIYCILNLILIPSTLYFFFLIAHISKSSSIMMILEEINFPVFKVTKMLGNNATSFLFFSLTLVNFIFSVALIKKLKIINHFFLLRVICLIISILSLLMLIIIMLLFIMFLNGGPHVDLRT